jgi:hypothetical protein
MRFNQKAIVLFLTAAILTSYTIAIHAIADGHMHEDTVTTLVYWTGGPSGSLFPWPKAPGMLDIIIQVNEVDLFIYQYLIKTWALAGLSIVVWIITVLYIFRIIKSTEQKMDIDKKRETTSGSLL